MQAPEYLKKLNPDAAREAEAKAAERERTGLPSGGGGKLDERKLQYLQQQLQLQEVQKQAIGAWHERGDTAHQGPPPAGALEGEEAGEMSLQGEGTMGAREHGAGPGTHTDGTDAAGESGIGTKYFGGAAKMITRLKSARARATSKIQGREVGEEGGGRPPDGEEGLDVDFGAPQEWTRNTLALVAQAQGTMIKMASKVDGLHDAFEELHVRMEKVETANMQDQSAEPEYNIFESGIDT
ncbi:hypothetical protein DUNSADRAFT_16961 [Dunaliella salina]|uniref:Uncharacterized protein n=1 Tax=Dunaliella salina TaxID=3046 RepID=A0ABQ7G2P5_DUNSA|nr:hypothetical protein DUNSADRAFT_16961 [Dunaliella salina]|eukprot:KAF5828875.1 hypothetical protein DUNSADRAFT_16961 [Dunaliella salina]